MNPFVFAGIAIIVTGVVLLVVADSFDLLDTLTNQQVGSVIAALALLVVIGSGALNRYRGQGQLALGHIAIWMVIALAFGVIYALRDPILSVLGVR